MNDGGPQRCTQLARASRKLTSVACVDRAGLVTNQEVESNHMAPKDDFEIFVCRHLGTLWLPEAASGGNKPTVGPFDTGLFSVLRWRCWDGR